MTIDFKDFSEDFLKEEQEKAQFGGEIYANHHKLPAIIIDNDNIQTYDAALEVIQNISEVNGSELAVIFGTLTILYKIDSTTPKDSTHTTIINACLKAICNQAQSLSQSKELINYLNINKGDKIIVDGSKYCFIVKMLMHAFSDFTSLFSLVCAKNYLSKETIDFMREKMLFLISPEVEGLRIAFKVIECYECLDAKPVLH